MMLRYVAHMEKISSHDNFTMGFNSTILNNLLYLFIPETYFTSDYLLFTHYTHYRYAVFKFLV